MFVTAPSSQSAEPGEMVTLKCRVDANPQPEVTWSRPNQSKVSTFASLPNTWKSVQVGYSMNEYSFMHVIIVLDFVTAGGGSWSWVGSVGGTHQCWPIHLLRPQSRFLPVRGSSTPAVAGSATHQGTGGGGGTRRWKGGASVWCGGCATPCLCHMDQRRLVN